MVDESEPRGRSTASAGERPPVSCARDSTRRAAARTFRGAVRAFCFAAFTVNSADAQLRGTVRTRDGEPVPGALVELFSLGRRIAGTGTDSLGRYGIASVPDSVALALLVLRMGFEPFRAQLRVSDTVVEVVLDPRPVELAAWSVAANQDECTERDDPRARALYLAAAARYDTELSASGVRATSLIMQAIVPPESVGVVDTSRLRFQAIGGSARLRWRDPSTSYARPASGVLLPRFDLWDYPFLESIEAWHFADTAFAQRNTLSMGPSADSAAALKFCSRRGRQPYIDGVLYLAPDSSFARASWRFVVPRSTEQAGGEVVFAPVPPGANGVPLLPISGLYWRRRVAGFYTEWMAFRQWSRCAGPGDCSRSLPFR